MGVWREGGDVGRDIDDGGRSDGTNSGMAATAEHMKPRVFVATESTWAGRGKPRRGGECPFGAMYVPVVGEFGNPSS